MTDAIRSWEHATIPDYRPLVQRWPETFSRRQRAEEAARLCTEAGIDLKSPGARRLVRDAENGMPLHDALDLIKHWNTTATTPPSSNEAT